MAYGVRQFLPDMEFENAMLAYCQFTNHPLCFISKVWDVGQSNPNIACQLAV